MLVSGSNTAAVGQPRTTRLARNVLLGVKPVDTLMYPLEKRKNKLTVDRRISDPECWDSALIMAIIYTTTYAAMITMIVFVEIPPANSDVVKILAGIMTAIQVNIVQYFFGNTKTADTSQRLIAQSKERTDSVLRDVVSAATPVTSAIPAKDVSVTAQGDVTVEAHSK